MQNVSLFQAKTHLSRLVEQLVSGAETEVLISRHGKPVARVVPVSKANVARRIGIAKGEFTVPDSIDRPNRTIARLFNAGRS